MSNLRGALKQITPLRYAVHGVSYPAAQLRDRIRIQQMRALVKNPPETIEKFQNRHRGERCFIIGNGPSLTIEDLERLSGEVTFASNRIYSAFDKTDWRPTYYQSADPDIARTMTGSEFSAVADAAEASFLSLRLADQYPAEARKREEVYFYFMPIANPFDQIRAEKGRWEPRFSGNFPRYAQSVATITYEMLQLAVYMGFTEITLLGVDHQYKKMVQNGRTVDAAGVTENYSAAIGDGGREIPAPVFNPKTTLGYESARRYAEAHGIRIQNATRGGALEVFPRVLLENIL